jgi:hypothetical protein
MKIYFLLTDTPPPPKGGPQAVIASPFVEWNEATLIDSSRKRFMFIIAVACNRQSSGTTGASLRAFQKKRAVIAGEDFWMLARFG